MYRKVAAVWVSLFIMVSSIVILVEIAERVEAPYIPHNPIRINSDAEFATMAGSEGWAGDGSLGNPYIIEGYDINGSGNGYCIYIGNTTVYFEVKDCYLHEASGGLREPYHPDSGMILYNAQNGIINNNNISSNEWYGIALYSSINASIVTNDMVENGIFIWGDILEHWNTHSIDTTNTVNGKPVHYWKNQNGGTIPIGTGQIILANSTNVIIENQNLSECSIGIELGFSNNNTIVANNATSNFWDGIRLYKSNMNIIANNNLSNHIYGIYLRDSINNTISNNKMFSIYTYSIWLSHSNNNTVVNNNLSSSNYGIHLSYSDDNTIAYNKALDNDYGITLSRSSRNTIAKNNALSSKYVGVSIAVSSNGNTIMKNNISNNNYGFRLFSSSNNNIYHNNIINNENQALDNTDNGNQWDDGYPSGGNFWSDYIGNDEYSGPNQDIPGNDGIGDSEYSLDSNSQDNYPLKSPIGPFIFLYNGWNFISIPSPQLDSVLKSVLSSIDGSYDAVQWYNVSDSLDHWKHNHISKPFKMNDLKKIDHKIGFWIHITDPNGVILNYSNPQPTSNQTIQLYKGWNMVGYPSLTNHNRTSGLNNLTFDTHVDAIQWYDASTKTWHFMGPDDSFVPGRGYWVHSKVEAEWEVPI